MTVTNRLNRATMDGNGVSTTLALDFPFHSVEDLVVIETILATGAETTKVLNTDYTIVGAQDDAGHYPDGGDIVFTVAPASTSRLDSGASRQAATPTTMNSNYPKASNEPAIRIPS